MTLNSWLYLIAFLGECLGAGILPYRNLITVCFHLYKSQGGYYLTARARCDGSFISPWDAKDIRREVNSCCLDRKFPTRGRQRVDDDLLKAMKENETMKVELPKKSIKDYKESVRFEWKLRRMGQVSYEYGYRVTLARFQTRYPDLEVDDDSFTGQPEDSLVLMETQPSFDDSILP
ncbi:hypothetical protein B296_00009162 [Ensete ventricosum]|uniref:Uncharacterized protein n=1 Tax=Ensete ventricosum TaxID=4639 RepID=A0A427A3L2_ENSVE|nr:hypothetical protein B296_00009162 [Ensete ventricosum]